MIEIDKIIKEIESENPYKEKGNPDSYSLYNEGWSDACNVLGDRIKRALEAEEGSFVKGATHTPEEKVNKDNLKYFMYNEEYYTSHKKAEWLDAEGLFFNPLTEQLENLKYKTNE